MWQGGVERKVWRGRLARELYPRARVVAISAILDPKPTAN